ncbi:MAG: hypothetical protein NT076_05630 [Candidatus Pacearchaeota archaeon]|nr:hypothetical protein [Candidatus Pacearchaeota archaeon]
MDILQDNKNPLLARRELKFITQAVKNPSFPETLDLVAEKFKAVKENVAVRAIRGKFGRDTFLIEALIYDNVEAREKHEPRKKVKKIA